MYISHVTVLFNYYLTNPNRYLNYNTKHVSYLMNAFNAPVGDYLPSYTMASQISLKLKTKQTLASLHHTLIFIKIQIQKDALKYIIRDTI